MSELIVFKPIMFPRTQKIYKYTLVNKVSFDEATLEILREESALSTYVVKEILKNYELLKEGPESKQWIVPPKDFKVYKSKNKKNYELFLKFYKAAKRDLKEKDKISEKTLELIKKGK